MSVRNFSDLGTDTKYFSSSVPNVSPSSSVWIRNPSWLAMTAPTESEEKFVGLHIVNQDSNFVALSATCSAGGDFTVNWGDGSVENIASGTIAYHEYSYTNASLDGTNAPVTFQDSTNTITRTNHGFANGMRVTFYNVVSTTGIEEGQIYYVINSTADTFQVSSTSSGSAVELVNDGSATLLPYKQAIVTVTPTSGQTLTALDLNKKHNKLNLQKYASGFVDIAIASSTLNYLTIGSSDYPGTLNQNIRFNLLEQVNILNSNLSNLSYLFNECSALRSILNFNISTGATIFANTFNNCYSLTSVPLFNTSAATDISGMFYGCSSLVSVPLFNTSTVTNTSSMFFSCYSLTSVPLFNTASVTNMSSMFNSCFSLTSVPLFNTASVTNMSSMFSNCRSLKAVPLLNTSAAVDTSGMFTNCSSLTSVPLFNTASVTNMFNMLSGCPSLTSVPLFNTASVTNMSSMFINSYSLTSVPLFNTASVTNMSNMFSGCRSLTSVPLFNTASVTTTGGMFNGCYSLTSVPLFNTASVTNMASMFNNCYSLASVPPFNTASVTTMSNMFSGCYSIESVNISSAVSATASSSYTGMFSTCSQLSRIRTADFKYSFSVANCKLSAAALNQLYTNLATVTGQTITVSGNHGTDADNPSIATAKGWTVTG